MGVKQNLSMAPVFLTKLINYNLPPKNRQVGWKDIILSFCKEASRGNLILSQ
jgi:hypothetical protein